MGNESGPTAIADTGPLIHLHEIGHLSLLQVIFSLVSVPQAVWDESIATGRIPAGDLEAVPAQRVSVTSDQLLEVSSLPETAGLHRGELECFALCRASRINLLLTDDLAARRAAQSLGIQPVGSLGVVVRACHQGNLSLTEAENAIERLHSTSTLFVTRAIVDLAIAQLRQTKH